MCSAVHCTTVQFSLWKFSSVQSSTAWSTAAAAVINRHRAQLSRITESNARTNVFCYTQA